MRPAPASRRSSRTSLPEPVASLRSPGLRSFSLQGTPLKISNDVTARGMAMGQVANSPERGLTRSAQPEEGEKANSLSTGKERMRAFGRFAQELHRARAAGGAWGSTRNSRRPLQPKSHPATPVRGGAYVSGRRPPRFSCGVRCPGKTSLTGWHCCVSPSVILSGRRLVNRAISCARPPRATPAQRALSMKPAGRAISSTSMQRACAVRAARPRAQAARLSHPTHRCRATPG